MVKKLIITINERNRRLMMTIIISWAKYLREEPEYSTIVNDTNYIKAWDNYLQAHKLPTNELVVIPNKLLIENKSMILDYLLINNTNKEIADVEMNITLSILGKEYFTGFLRTTRNSYESLPPNEARLDLIDFGNDRYENQELESKDFELTIYSCKSIEYLDIENEETQGVKDA
jgi:hypothetical protein